MRRAALPGKFPLSRAELVLDRMAHLGAASIANTVSSGGNAVACVGQVFAQGPYDRIPAARLSDFIGS